MESVCSFRIPANGFRSKALFCGDSTFEWLPLKAKNPEDPSQTIKESGRSRTLLKFRRLGAKIWQLTAARKMVEYGITANSDAKIASFMIIHPGFSKNLIYVKRAVTMTLP
jgi:hypothetical protein